MNIYFTISYRGAEKYKDNVNKMIKHLKDSNHKVSKRVFQITSDGVKNATNEVDELLDFRTGNLSDTYKAIVKRIREADVVIADTSVPSSGVGYEIAIAQSEKKPILVLHNEEMVEYIADVFAGNTSKLFELVKYKTVDDAIREMDKFLVSARASIDTKFILIISPEIDKYLEWSAEEKRMHKAQIVREAIESSMNKDKEYKEFQKQD